MRPYAWTLLSVCASAAGLVSCSGATCDTSDDSTPPIRYEDGFVTDGYYQSSSAHGPLLHFPGGARYDLYHHLGYEPISVQLSWSDRPEGIGTDVQTGVLTPGTGNSALIQLKNDRFVRVKNDSCTELWLWVVAGGNSGTPAPRDAGIDPLPPEDSGGE